jgi:hypothetical protein
LIFWLNVYIGVPLFFGGIGLQRAGSVEVGGVVRWIGGIWAAIGFVGGMSLLGGGLNLLALIAAVAAYFGETAPQNQRIGFWLLAVGLALGAWDKLQGRSAEWLVTLAIIAAGLGLAALVNAWLRGRAPSPGPAQ